MSSFPVSFTHQSVFAQIMLATEPICWRVKNLFAILAEPNDLDTNGNSEATGFSKTAGMTETQILSFHTYHLCDTVFCCRELWTALNAPIKSQIEKNDMTKSVWTSNLFFHPVFETYL